MSSEQLLWIVIALVQLAVVVVAAVYVRRHPSRQYWMSGSMLLGVGVLIVVASVAWLLTGGEGRSPILMRGGWVGFWLGLATAAETILLGILLFANRQDTNRELRSLRNGPRVQVQRCGFSAADEKARS